MVSGIFKFINKGFGGLHEAALLLAVLMFLSQILALIRDRLLASIFGAGMELDIYYSAFRIPDFIYATIASFVSAAVLIPFLMERLERNQVEAARRFMSAVFSLFISVMVLVSGIVFWLMPSLAAWLVPGFEQAAQTEMVLLARILLLSPLLLGLSNLLGSVTQAHQKFFIYSLSPILYNVGIIVGLIFLVPRLGLLGLVLGVILGAGLHLAIQLPTLRQTGFWPSLRWQPSFWRQEWHLVTKTVLLSWPRTVTLSANQLVILVLVAMASYLESGAIAVFNFANNLQSVPLVIIGLSYSVAAFPTLSRHLAGGRIDQFVAQMTMATKQIVFWSLPVMVMFIVLRAQIVRVILGSGNFDWTATRLTAACLAVFAVSVLAQSLVMLLVRGYYAAGETRKPLLATLGASVVTILAAVIFRSWWGESETFRLFWENLLRLRGLPNTEILVLPLAYSLGVIFNLFILTVLAVRDWRWSVRPFLVVGGQSLAAAVLGGLTAYYWLNVLSLYLNLQTLAGIFWQGLLAGLGGLFINLFVLWLMNSSELKDIWRALHRKFWRADALVPEQTEL